MTSPSLPNTSWKVFGWYVFGVQSYLLTFGVWKPSVQSKALFWLGRLENTSSCTFPLDPATLLSHLHTSADLGWMSGCLSFSRWFLWLLGEPFSGVGLVTHLYKVNKYVSHNSTYLFRAPITPVKPICSAI